MNDTSSTATDVPPAPRHRRSTPTPPRFGVLPLGTVFLLATVVMGIIVRANAEQPPFQGPDDLWLAWMGGPHDGLYEAVATVLDWFGGPVGVVIPVALLIFLIARKRWWSLLFLLTTYLANIVVVQTLKYLVDRPRPENPMVRVDHGSFPSGHVAGTALLVVIVGALLIPAARRRAWWLGGVLFTMAMMWSRTWLHAHWLSDAVAGAMTGAAVALVLWWAFAARLAREGSRQATAQAGPLPALPPEPQTPEPEAPEPQASEPQAPEPQASEGR